METCQGRRFSLFPHPEALPSPRRPRRRFQPRLERFEDRTVLSTLTVTNALDSGAGSLRAAIKAAGSGDTIVFASSLNGQTITLTSGELAISKSLDIEGPGAGLLAISGNNASRVFDISQNQKPVTVTIASLSIENGRSPGADGGGILNVSSTLTLTGDVLANNEALSNSPNNDGRGGAVASENGATLFADNCSFLTNQVIGADGGGTAGGGAIRNFKRSTATVRGCTFTGNRAIGGNGGVISNGGAFVGVGAGGALYNDTGCTFTVENTTFTCNQAVGGNGGSGGAGANGPLYDVGLGVGGAIQDTEGTLFVSGCAFSYNQAIGGSNATGGTGGAGRVGRRDRRGRAPQRRAGHDHEHHL